MKDLLEHDFISHYGLTVSVPITVYSTDHSDFELVDDSTLICSLGNGIAKYSNPNRKTVNVINYEAFINSLPQTFQNGREKCDLIVSTSDLSFFLLNELSKTQLQYVEDFTQSDGSPRIGKKNKAISQLKRTLKDLSAVPAIDTFIKRHKTKHCCFFNKPPLPPPRITATIAFNRLASITPNGLNMRNPDMEALGFELWEFSDEQVYLLK
jgi:hypothetical protein